MNLRSTKSLTLLAALALACGTAVSQPERPKNEVLLVCPEGSVFDPQMGFCIARAQATPPQVATATVAPSDAGPAPPATSDPFARPLPTATATATAAAALPPPPAGTLAIDVTCAFANGYVTVLPVAAYPRDEDFVMQALIGFSTDPSFWKGLGQYKPLMPYAARPCSTTPQRFPVASGADVYVLVGQADTFSTKGKYDRNGMKQRLHVTASTTIAATMSSLTHTWLCISCPWVVVSDERGPREAFVMLGGMDEEKKRGKDTRLVRDMPVREGKVRFDVREGEDEETRLDAFWLVVRDAQGREHALAPVVGSALAVDDGLEVRLRKGGQIKLEYDVSAYATGDAIDARLEASGYYVRRPR